MFNIQAAYLYSIAKYTSSQAMMVLTVLHMMQPHMKFFIDGIVIENE